MGKSSINGPFSMAMLNNQMVDYSRDPWGVPSGIHRSGYNQVQCQTTAAHGLRRCSRVAPWGNDPKVIVTGISTKKWGDLIIQNGIQPSNIFQMGWNHPKLCLGFNHPKLGLTIKHCQHLLRGIPMYGQARRRRCWIFFGNWLGMQLLDFHVSGP